VKSLALLAHGKNCLMFSFMFNFSDSILLSPARNSRLLAQSIELTRGPPELVQHFRYIGGVHNGARALRVLNLIWFGYIARLSQWGGGGGGGG
jgi:hypothetical protein